MARPSTNHRATPNAAPRALAKATLITLGVTFAALPGCVGGTETVRLRLTGWPGAGDPIAAARVRVVALDTGDAPLPVDRAALEEALTPPHQRSGFTDEAGEIELDLLRGRPWMVLASPPPLSWDGPAPTWAWTMPTDSGGAPTRNQRTLEPVRHDPSKPPASVRLDLLR